MPIINNPFNGKLNLDVAEYRISNGDYIDALNITKDAQGRGQDRVVSNIIGNTLIPYTLPSGTNKIIGFYADKIRNRAYYFLWNSNGYDSILYYDLSNDTITKVLENKTDSDGIDILNFNPSYKVLSVNIFYRDDEGDLLFFNDGLNPPKVINVSEDYGTSWKLEYILVAKAPPVMPPKVVYENDENVKINNLRNKLFQFSYRFVYQNNEKSVWSSKSIVPLPQQSTFQLTDDNNFTNNSLISISVSTGGIDVKAIEISFRETSNALTSDWFLIRQINKADNSIRNNDIYTYKFYNDSIYSQIDVIESTQLQDYVPQIANAAELANGNVLLYSGITEGYDKTNMNLFSSAQRELPPYYFDKNGLLFFAASNGLDSGSIGTTMSVYLYGTIQEPPIPTTTTTTSAFTTTTTTLPPTTKFYETVLRRRCSTGVENPVRSYIYFANNSYTPSTSFWYKDDACPYAAYKLLNTTPIYNVTGILLLSTEYTTGALACDCVTTTSTTTTVGPGTSTTTSTTTLAPKVLNNASGVYVINVVNNSGVDIGVSYSYTSSDYASISTILSSISTLLQSKGWVQNSLVGNVLTVTYANGFNLLSSGVKTLRYPTDEINTVFANAWESGYQYALQYFDSLGRTIGAQTSINATFNTPVSNGYPYPTTTLQIKNRPPLEAIYYQVLRSNNTSYNKRLFWISNSAYSSPRVPDYIVTIPIYENSSQKFAYINVDNIEAYNIGISSTQNVVSYSFSVGDRIRFLGRFTNLNQEISFTKYYDYQIIGAEGSIQTVEGLKTGNFIKIYYPEDDISDDFNFDGTEDFLHYKIFIYNYVNNSSSTQQSFYEFGKCFGIGNAGTNNAYHIGLEQTQSSTNPENVPAIVSCTNGDLFYRQRIVPYNNYYLLNGLGQDVDPGVFNPLFKIAFPSPATTVETDLYIIKTQDGDSINVFDDNYFFYNKSTNVNIEVKINCSFKVTADARSSFGVYAAISPGPRGGIVLQPLTEPQTIVFSASEQVNIDKTIVIAPQKKVWIVVNVDTGFDPISISTSEFNFRVLYKNTIRIIEPSFTDTNNLVTNSNGRPSVIEENAKRTYFPTLIRFGGAYQVNTNINQINNFKYENFDEYDRSFGDVIRLHVRDRYLKVYQKFKVGNVPILTQIVKDSTNNPLQANTDTLINKIQYYSGDYGIGDAATSLAWNNFSDYFVDNYRGVVCRLSQDGITPISILYNTNAFFVPLLQEYRQELNNGVPADGQVYTGNPCIYGVFDAYTNKYIIAMEEINRYSDCNYNGGSAVVYVPTTTTTSTTSTTTVAPITTTTTTTAAPVTTTTTSNTTSTTSTTSTSTTSTSTTTTAAPFYSYICNGSPECIAYDSLINCQDSGCQDCVQGICPP